MADQEFYHYLNDLQARSKVRRWWTKALVVCAVLGGIYGAMIGSAIATSAGAANVIGAAAGIVALLLAIPGARYGFFFGRMMNRFLKTLNSLPHTHGNDRGTYIDATFRR